MKNLIATFLFYLIVSFSFAQGETISTNIFQDNGRLGIGLSTPGYLLDINADVGAFEEHPRQFIHLHNTSNSSSSNVAIGLRSGTDYNESYGSFGVCALSYVGNPSLSGLTYMYSPSNGIALRAVGDEGLIKFNTGGNGDEYERMRIDNVGNVGIGTINPKAKLQVANGDIFISEISKGIIMKSPDGNCWRGVLDNNGNLTFTAIECPDQGSVGLTNSSTVENKIEVYPNPAQSKIMVELSEQRGVSEYKIYTVSGYLVDNGFISENLCNINIKDLAPGSYVISIYSVDGTQFAKKMFVKQ
jgi:hypothetical protein